MKEVTAEYDKVNTLMDQLEMKVIFTSAYPPLKPSLKPYSYPYLLEGREGIQFCNTLPLLYQK
jgi:hypothetical protein